jgi:hypothetical protein
MYCIDVMGYIHKPHEEGPVCSSGRQLQTPHCRGAGPVPVELMWDWLWTGDFVFPVPVVIPPVLHTVLPSGVATTGPFEVLQTVYSSVTSLLLLLLHHKCCGRSINDAVSITVVSGM